jgi:hypothetical protein
VTGVLPLPSRAASRREERRLAQVAFDLFSETMEWPPFRQVERAVVSEMDAEEVVKRLLPDYGYWSWSPNQQVVLPTRVILECEGVEATFSLLVKALPIIEEVYLTAPEGPKLTDKDLLDRGWQPNEVARLGKLLWAYCPFGSGGGMSGDGSWHRDLRPSTRRYSRSASATDILKLELQERKQETRRRRRGEIRAMLTTGAKRFLRDWFFRVTVGVGVLVIVGLLVRGLSP